MVDDFLCFLNYKDNESRVKCKIKNSFFIFKKTHFKAVFNKKMSTFALYSFLIEERFHDPFVRIELIR